VKGSRRHSDGTPYDAHTVDEWIAAVQGFGEYPVGGQITSPESLRRHLRAFHAHHEAHHHREGRFQRGVAAARELDSEAIAVLMVMLPELGERLKAAAVLIPEWNERLKAIAAGGDLTELDHKRYGLGERHEEGFGVDRPPGATALRGARVDGYQLGPNLGLSREQIDRVPCKEERLLEQELLDSHGRPADS